MCKPSTYLLVTYFPTHLPTYLPMYVWELFSTHLPTYLCTHKWTYEWCSGPLDEARSTESRRLVGKSGVLPRAYRGREVDNA